MRLRVLAPALVGLAVLASAAAAPAAGPKTVAVVSIALPGTPINHERSPKGPSKGDTVVFRDRLVNAVAAFGKPKGAVVGSDRGTMTFQSAHTATYAGTATLPGGTLVVRGPVASVPGGGIVIPVTSGTGRYKGARGILVVGPGAKRSLNTYRLTYAAPAPSGPVA